nr:hypothetical protein Iba_scaffold6854CG0070 [Ipomoea batatas]
MLEDSCSRIWSEKLLCSGDGHASYSLPDRCITTNSTAVRAKKGCRSFARNTLPLTEGCGVRVSVFAGNIIILSQQNIYWITSTINKKNIGARSLRLEGLITLKSRASKGTLLRVHNSANQRASIVRNPEIPNGSIILCANRVWRNDTYAILLHYESPLNKIQTQNNRNTNHKDQNFEPRRTTHSLEGRRNLKGFPGLANSEAMKERGDEQVERGEEYK